MPEHSRHVLILARVPPAHLGDPRSPVPYQRGELRRSTSPVRGPRHPSPCARANPLGKLRLSEGEAPVLALWRPARSRVDEAARSGQGRPWHWQTPACARWPTRSKIPHHCSQSRSSSIRRSVKTSPFFPQARLLVRALPFVYQEECFALKGGTAINLFVRDLARLSDIDLVYLPIQDS